MKIAFYVPAWPPGRSANGIVTYAAQLVPALRRLGHEVYILSSNMMEPPQDKYAIDLNKVDVRPSILSRLIARIHPDDFVFDLMTSRLASALRELKAKEDIDIFEMEDSFGWGGRVAKEKVVPVVIRLHGPWFLNGQFETRRAGHKRKVTREGKGIRAASLVTSPSAMVLNQVRLFYRSKLEHAKIIPNPILPALESTIWRLDACDTKRILFVGRFDRRKGGDLVLSAFEDLTKSNKDLRLTFVGPDGGVEGLNRDRLSFHEYMRRTLPKTIWSKIDFLGQLPTKQIAELRSKHLLTIVASQFEILPYAVLEAMSFGSPIIASRVGGIPELIRHEENGLLFDTQDASAMVAACRRLIEDNALAAKLGAQARLDCASLYNPVQIAIETISAYQAALKHNSPAG
jgi:glycosyltransferase involved in cell wall biosynthesis